jgi:hypothetical protein
LGRFNAARLGSNGSNVEWRFLSFLTCETGGHASARRYEDVASVNRQFAERLAQGDKITRLARGREGGLRWRSPATAWGSPAWEWFIVSSAKNPAMKAGLISVERRAEGMPDQYLATTAAGSAPPNL